MSHPDTPSLGRRLLCAMYDGLLLCAVLLVATFPFVAVTRGLAPETARHGLQGYLLLVMGIYFTVFWRKGQTLAMKTWKFRMETRSGAPLSWRRAWLRYTLAWANLVLLGLGWWAALFRADGQFLQDRLAGTCLVNSKPD